MTIPFERIQAFITMHLEHEHMDNFTDPLELEAYYDLMAHMMVLRLKSFIYRHEIDKIKYPLNWKESLKERFFPNWLLNKFPIKYRTHSVYEFYPNLTFPKDKQPIVYLKVD